MRFSRNSFRRTALPAGLGALVLSSWVLQAAQDGAPWELHAPAPEISFSPTRLEGLEGYACATCHRDVVDEWADSAHALAWEDEEYQSALKKKRRPLLCHSCHIPQPIVGDTLAKRPKAREDTLHLGVSCESCHEGPGGAMLGPRGTETSAHPSVQSEYMSEPGSNALCASCHATNIGPVIGIAKDFEKAKLAERGFSCVGCHMGLVERRWAEDPEAPGESPVRSGRSHAIQTPRDPAFLRLAFEVELVTEGKPRVVVRNRAGHRVPGLTGREIVFRAVLLDDSGAEIETQELTFDTSAFLPVDGSRGIEFTESGSQVRLTGNHVDPRADEPVLFLDERLSSRE